MIAQQIKSAVRDIPDFPKPGIVFKDITPILKDPKLCENIVDAFVDQLKGIRIDVIAGVESRGFLFGLTLATRLGVPFIPVRKAGKLPYTIRQKAYKLEYGTAASELIKEMGGVVAGFSFVVGLGFLNGIDRIKPISDNIIVLADY